MNETRDLSADGTRFSEPVSISFPSGSMRDTCRIDKFLADPATGETSYFPSLPKRICVGPTISIRGGSCGAMASTVGERESTVRAIIFVRPYVIRLRTSYTKDGAANTMRTF